MNDAFQATDDSTLGKVYLASLSQRTMGGRQNTTLFMTSEEEQKKLKGKRRQAPAQPTEK